MTDDELTGTLQARGNNTVTIDGQEFNVPDYVVDWMKNMQRPLQDGETVLYKKSQSKEGGAWYLTKIRRPPKSNTNAGPQVDQKSGVLISHFNTGCTVRMANGDKNYALTKPFPKDVELPQKMEFSIDKQGFILGYKFWGKADLALQENLDRAKFTPATEVKKEEPKPPQAEPKTSAPSTSQPAPEFATLTIVHTVNLGNYESLKIGIEGPAGERVKLEQFLDDTLSRYGRAHPPTTEAIDTYRRRVMGVRV